ncbi:MAG: Flp pilus assembly protein CpaB [Acetobacteraceae bacterium]|nr:Flp pilus assembly protein CpaB [Acetobacteraceae bacterium]
MRVLLGVIMLAALAGLGLIGMLALAPPAPAPPPAPIAAPAPPPRISVLAAARPIAAGSLLKIEDLTTRAFAPGEAPDDALLDAEQVREELRGAMVRRPLSAGELLRPDDVLRPRDRGFLAAVLGRGMRAVSVGVDMVSGAAGLIWPGDRIDLILTQSFDDEKVPIARRVIGETVLADVRVIAVDQALAQGADGALTTEGRLVRTVTLEVNPDQAEKVAVAARLGRLALSVRAIEMPEEAVAEGPQRATFAADVSPALRVPDPAVRGIPTMRVHLGTRVEEMQLR